MDQIRALLVLAAALAWAALAQAASSEVPPPPPQLLSSQVVGVGALPIWNWARNEFYYAEPARGLIFTKYVQLGADDISEYKGPGGAALWQAAGANPPTKPRSFVYELDFALCEYVGCNTATMRNPVLADDSGIPEAYFLHFATTTTIMYRPHGYPVSGATNGGDVTYTITGCPSPAPITKSCRVRLGQWDGTHYVLYMGNPAERTWNANRMYASVQSKGVQGLFLDAHAPTFASLYVLNFSAAANNENWVKTSCSPGPCGTIREYNQDLAHTKNFQATWNADWVSSLSETRALLNSHGVFQCVNSAGYSPASASMNAQVIAAGGAHAEAAFGPGLDRDQYAGWISLINSVSQLTLGVIDMSNPTCFDCEAYPYGLSGPAGNYNTASERARAFRFVQYQIMREVAGRPGHAYFDPPFWPLDANGKQFAQGDLSFITKMWLPNYYTLLPEPTSAATVVQSGNGPVGTCDNNVVFGYVIYKRTLPDGTIILLRPRDGYACSQYGDLSAVRYALGGTFHMKHADGSLGPPVSSISLRNAEGVIMVP